jgi:hypothetical protein
MKKGLTGIVLAMMAISILSFVPNFAAADAERPGTWVRMNGNITQWNMTNGNTTRTFGWITANAAIVNKNGTLEKWARVYATWSDLVRAYPGDEHPLGQVNLTDTGGIEGDDHGPGMGNFSLTFSFFTARLLNLSDLSFNKTETGHDFYLTGYWNVSQVTEIINSTWGENTRQITVNWTEEPLAIDATGNLTADWGIVMPPKPGEMPGPIGIGTFELQIDGVGTLSGFAWKSFMWARELNICDFDGQGKVGLSDLVKVARHYGETPGFGNYDPSLDVNGDGRIGIGDLTTIASNIQG